MVPASNDPPAKRTAFTTAAVFVCRIVVVGEYEPAEAGAPVTMYPFAGWYWLVDDTIPIVI